MENTQKRNVPLANIDNSELMSIKKLEENLGDKYYIIAYKKN